MARDSPLEFGFELGRSTDAAPAADPENDPYADRTVGGKRSESDPS